MRKSVGNLRRSWRVRTLPSAGASIAHHSCHTRPHCCFQKQIATAGLRNGPDSSRSTDRWLRARAGAAGRTDPDSGDLHFTPTLPPRPSPIRCAACLSSLRTRRDLPVGTTPRHHHLPRTETSSAKYTSEAGERKEDNDAVYEVIAGEIADQLVESKAAPAMVCLS